MTYVSRVTFAVAVLAAALAVPASAHKWYDLSCCGENDCEAIPFEAVTEMQNGWQLDYWSARGFKVHAFVERGKQRDSQDGQFHGCAAPAGFYCLYVPVNV